MARQGIYVNGKEIVARYIGDKLVWQKELEKLWTTWSYDKVWSRSYSLYNSYVAETVEYFSTSITDNTEVPITRVSIGNSSWKAKTFGISIEGSSGNKKRVITRIHFYTSTERNSFIHATQLQRSGEIKIYKENV